MANSKRIRMTYSGQLAARPVSVRYFKKVRNSAHLVEVMALETVGAFEHGGFYAVSASDLKPCTCGCPLGLPHEQGLQ